MTQSELQPVTIPRHGVVTLSGYGISVRVDRGHLLFEDGIGTARRHARLSRVGHGLKRLVVIGTDGFVSLSALRWITDQKASFIMLDRDGTVLATTTPNRSADAKLRRFQAIAHQSGAALRISRELIDRKLAGQEQVARISLHDPNAADAVKRFRAELAEVSSIDALRLVEARAAQAYWSAWQSLTISYPRQDLPRIPEHWRRFDSRISPISGSPRLATNPVNSMLNFLYSLTEAESGLAACIVGLDPSVGFLHVDASYRDSLACDLMEPIRPQVDAFVLDWVSRDPLSRNWFFEQRDGNCRLMAPFAARLAETSRNWAQLVAPYAEWVAQMLTNSDSKSNASSRPTPLTQRRKSEGRGNTFEPERVRFDSPAKVCRICSKEIESGKYCSGCAVIASRENMTMAALKWHATPKKLQVRKRTKKLQSEHAVALTWWNPESLPKWLTEEFYLQQIQPKLRSITISELAAILGLSKTYTASIRNGSHKAHPRHWNKLAKLVGQIPNQSYGIS